MSGGGFEAIAGVPRDRILVFGIDVWRETLPAELADAHVVDLTTHDTPHERAPRQAVAALRALNRRPIDVTVCLQPYRKLKLLSLGTRARRRFAIQNGRLVPISAAALTAAEVARLARPVRHAASLEVRREHLRADFGRPEHDSSPPAPHEGPKVSVYVPAYQAGAWIERTVNSALSQTFEDLEVCIADDGSTDDTLAVLERAFSDEPRVRWTTKPNGGIASASNAAVHLCRGVYILQLDADDELLPRCAEVLAGVLDEHPRASVVYGGFEAVDPRKSLYEVDRVVPPPYDAFAHLHGNVVTHPRMFRARAFHRTAGFDETLVNAVDFDIYLKLAEVGDLIAVPEVLYRYYIHGKNTSVAQRPAQLENHRLVIERALARRGLPWKVDRPDPTRPRHVVLQHASRRAALEAWLRARTG